MFNDINNNDRFPANHLISNNIIRNHNVNNGEDKTVRSYFKNSSSNYNQDHQYDRKNQDYGNNNYNHSNQLNEENKQKEREEIQHYNNRNENIQQKEVYYHQIENRNMIKENENAFNNNINLNNYHEINSKVPSNNLKENFNDNYGLSEKERDYQNQYPNNNSHLPSNLHGLNKNITNNHNNMYDERVFYY
jgi:hypothetical protein